MLKAAIVGYGGIAQQKHVPAYKELEEKGKVRLIAAFDSNPAQFEKRPEINLKPTAIGYVNLRTYTDLDEMLKNEEIDIIDICVPTFLHAQYTVDMLKRGYHVICEKPMASTFIECKTVIETAKAAKGKLMIGQCLRFSEEYLFLRDLIRDNTFGRPVAAVFRRFSAPPLWTGASGWYMNHAKSGGSLRELHIHDIDMARFLFGEPEAVSCITGKIYAEDDIVHSRLIYPNIAVLAIADWTCYGIEFSADYRIGFEKATVVYEEDVVTVYPRDGEPWKPEFNGNSMYTGTLEYFIDVVLKGADNTRNPIESTAETIKLCETLKNSAEQNGKIISL